MPKKRTPALNMELAEFLKFLHIHNLVDIISIIESIPIYYQTQIKKYNNIYSKIDNVNLQKMRLQNLAYIAKNLYNFSFPSFKFDFQTWRIGPFSLDIENELQNLIYSDIFNNAISSKKTFAKRYRITEYDKKYIIDCFGGSQNNYINFLNLVSDKNIYFLKDICLLIDFHNHHNNPTSKIYRVYISSDINKQKILEDSLDGLTCRKKNYIKKIIDVYFEVILLQSGNLQNQP